MAYIVELDNHDMELLNEGQRLTVKFGSGAIVEIVGKKLKKDYSTYNDEVVKGLELKYGKGNF